MNLYIIDIYDLDWKIEYHANHIFTMESLPQINSVLAYKENNWVVVGIRYIADNDHTQVYVDVRRYRGY